MCPGGEPMKSESLFQYLDRYLGIAGHPDYARAFNGLQVQGSAEVHRVVAAVDASEASIAAAAAKGADLLLVHHGLFWDGLAPVTGRRYRRLRLLLGHGMGLYSAHLPLDAHAEVGNCILLARALDLEPRGRFGTFEGADIGWWGTIAGPEEPDRFRVRVADAVGGGRVHWVAGGPARIERVGVVTGAGGSLVEEAAAAELDALVTGEGAHHHHHDAMEQGIHLFLAGHYATETFGVRALAAHVAERFGLEWEFLDQPTGL
ncbi:MAG: Nif3-like dinuclear metal center hexameric protein [Gemmatimonadetes bacterium]|nr:Nif3-like dinuclear metal center hexameric protein [Gemmatimonadota bacterium]